MGKEIRKRRVVVTGLGLITPLGTGVEKTWNALCAGKSGIRRITKFDPSAHACQIAGEVTDFDPADYFEKKEIKKMDTFIHYAVAASQMAVDDAGFKVTAENADRVGVYIGSGIGGLQAIEAFHKVLLEKGPDRGSPFFIPMVILKLASGPGSMRIYAEILGYGMTADAHHITAPPEDGRGAVQCMRRALQDAGLPPDAIGYVNAHATSTMADRVETSAIKQVFGTHARSLAVSSTKSMTGHLLGAAGGVEAVFSVLAIHRGILPPTINQEVPDPECDLDYVPNVARRAEVRAVLSNSFGFGGVNACPIFSRCTA